MKQINLLPKSQQQEVKTQVLARKLVVFWIWVAGSLVVLLLLALATRLYLNREIASTQKQIDADKALLATSDYRGLQKEVISLNTDIGEIANLRAQHYEWSDALVQLANLVPPTMQLNTVTLDASTGAIQIAGQAKTRQDVIAFWQNVIKSQYFTNIDFPLTNLEKADLPAFTFTFYVNKDKFQAQ